MADPRKRDDISPFLVHLTRASESCSAIENLVSILKSKKIEARNPHCLVARKFDSMNFNRHLQKKFNTVCLTETPLHQISKLIADIPGRRIKLEPYGLVFKRSEILDRGGSPAIYINADGTNLAAYMLEEFNNTFSSFCSYGELQDSESYPDEIIHYYALVNIMAKRHDFSWEREWRVCGDFKFKYHDLIAVIADEREDFLDLCQQKLRPWNLGYIQRIPVSSPNLSYEEIIQEMSDMRWRERA
jgi:hypothetical protein